MNYVYISFPYELLKKNKYTVFEMKNKVIYLFRTETKITDMI
jgi:hypothetical protein